jgi:hypothetical protein
LAFEHLGTGVHTLGAAVVMRGGDSGMVLEESAREWLYVREIGCLGSIESPRRVRRVFSLRLQRVLGPGFERSRWLRSAGGMLSQYS